MEFPVCNISCTIIVVTSCSLISNAGMDEHVDSNNRKTSCWTTPQMIKLWVIQLLAWNIENANRSPDTPDRDELPNFCPHLRQLWPWIWSLPSADVKAFPKWVTLPSWWSASSSVWCQSQYLCWAQCLLTQSVKKSVNSDFCQSPLSLVSALGSAIDKWSITWHRANIERSAKHPIIHIDLQYLQTLWCWLVRFFILHWRQSVIVYCFDYVSIWESSDTFSLNGFNSCIANHVETCLLLHGWHLIKWEGPWTIDK